METPPRSCVIEPSTSEMNFSDCEEPLKQRILSKFFRIKSAQQAAQLSDLNQLNKLSRHQIERYRSKMMDSDPMELDDENITVADDIQYGIGGRALLAIVLGSMLTAGALGLGAYVLGRSSTPAADHKDTDTRNTIRFE